MNLVARFQRLSISLIIILGLLLISVSTAQAAECKGLSKTKCGTANCTWVKSYKTKKGNTVNGYCRNKPSKSAKKKSDSSKKNATSKSTSTDSKEKKAKKSAKSAKSKKEKKTSKTGKTAKSTKSKKSTKAKKKETNKSSK